MSEREIIDKAYKNLRETLSPQQVWDICVLIDEARRNHLWDWEFDHAAQESFQVPDLEGTLLLLANRFRTMLDDGSEFNPVVDTPRQQGGEGVA